MVRSGIKLIYLRKNFDTMMKSLIFAAAMAILPLGVSAQNSGGTVPQPTAADNTFLDMAVDMAQMSVEKGGAPGGAVIILNGAYHAAGNGEKPELDALQHTHAPTLANAAVYTVNEPVTEAWVELSRRGVAQIYYANPREDVIESGIYRDSDYDESALPAGASLAVKKQLSQPSAAALIER